MQVKGDLQIKGQRLGFIVQQVESVLTTQQSGTSSVPIDNTIPQITEGDEVTTVSITPSGIGNIIVIDAIGYGYNGAGANIMSIHKVGNNDALVSAMANINGVAFFCPFILSCRDTVTSLSSTTYTFRTGCSSGTWVLGYAYLGTAGKTTLRVTEYCIN